MRDLLLAVLLAGSCGWALRAPWIGAITWTVVSLASPHIAFGYGSATWPVAMLVASCTFIGMLFNKERINPFYNSAIVLTALLMVWMTITLPLSLVPELCYDTWDRSMKITVMLLVTIALLDTRKKLEVFIWTNVCAIGYWGVKGGVFSIMTGGNSIILGPGGFIGENNALALAEIVILPLLRYVQLQAGKRWIRLGLGAAMALIAIAALVSHSRGALLGMIAMALIFWWRNKNKARWAVMLVLAAAVALAALPDEYWARMGTINTYEEDNSAQGRINSWRLAFNIANDRFFGGGFRLTVPWIFAKYAPNPRVILVAHSIYFQMLGEQGYVGLLLFLSIGITTWLNATKLRSIGKGRPDLKWAHDLGSMVQVSMVGYAVTGAFLSMALFDLPYNMMAITALGLRLALETKEGSLGVKASAGPNREPRSMESGLGPVVGRRKQISRASHSKTEPRHPTRIP